MIGKCTKNILSKKVAERISSNINNALLMPFPEDCKHCGKCEKNCPANAIRIDTEWKVDLGKCIFCLECTEVCPESLLKKIEAPDYVLDKNDLIITESKKPDYSVKLLPVDIAKAFGRSVSIREIDAGSCNACETEINCCSNPYYDMSRFGMKIVASPRHADMLLVTGPMTRNMTEATKRTYEATANPKIVVACGTCAISGGLFVEGDVTPGLTDGTIKSDIYIIGCPPSADRIIRSIMSALGITERR